MMRSHMHREQQTLEYQEALLSELCRMASENKQDMLSYLLGMAYIELSEMLGRPTGTLPRSAIERRAASN
jgi:DNA-directed RNA polymerase specialized sigma24 family protein